MTQDFSLRLRLPTTMFTSEQLRLRLIENCFIENGLIIRTVRLQFNFSQIDRQNFKHIRHGRCQTISLCKRVRSNIFTLKKKIELIYNLIFFTPYYDFILFILCIFFFIFALFLNSFLDFFFSNLLFFCLILIFGFFFILNFLEDFFSELGILQTVSFSLLFFLSFFFDFSFFFLPLFFLFSSIFVLF